MRDLLYDLRHALRGFRKAPGFFLAAVTILALGTGVNLAMVGLVDHILLRPLAYPDSERLVAVFEHLPARGELRNPTSPATFRDWSEGSRQLEHMTAAHPWSAILRGSGPAIEIPALRASAGLFSMLGVEPLVGRTVAEEDERVVVLGFDLWQRVFGGDSAIVGQTISLDSEPFTVIGVMPRGFAFPPFWASDSELWAPLVLDADQAANRNARFLRVFARLRANASVDEARSELGALSSSLAAAHPDALGGVEAWVEPLIEPVVGKARQALFILLFAVGCILLLAASNVGNLVLVRSLARHREMAVRRALGARRSRIVRLLLVESALLGTVGTAVGALLAWWLVDAIATLGRTSLPRLDTLVVDERMLAYAAVVAIVTVTVFGMAPALRLSHHDLAAGLRVGGTGLAERRGYVRSVVVVVELAAAMMLLVGAGLMLASLANLGQTDLGVRIDRSLVVPVAFAGTEHVAVEAQAAFFDTITEAMNALPEVEATGLVNQASIAGDLWRTSFVAAGQSASDAIEEKPKAAFRVVSNGYFTAAGIALHAGRRFDTRDRADSAPVVIVNRTLAERFFAGQDAIGERLLLGQGHPESDAVTIVGVVADTRQKRLRDATLPEIYHPYSQNPTPSWHATMLVLHTADEAEHAATAVVGALRATAPDVAIGTPRAMTKVVHGSLSETRFQTTALGTFSLLATALAVLGVFGLMSFLVSQQRNEIGLRMVVGARRSDIASLIFGGAGRLVAMGLGLGLLGALALARALEHLVYGVSVFDVRTLLGAAVALAAAALIAAALPAWRASRIDPMESLRST